MLGCTGVIGIRLAFGSGFLPIKPHGEAIGRLKHGGGGFVGLVPEFGFGIMLLLE